MKMTEAEFAIAMRKQARIEMKAFRLAEMVDGHSTPEASRAGGRNASQTRPPISAFQKCADEGMSKIGTARHLGVTLWTVRHLHRTGQVIWPDGRETNPGGNRRAV